MAVDVLAKAYTVKTLVKAWLSKALHFLSIVSGGGGGGSTPAWFSDWRFLTGQSDNALKDGDGAGTPFKWSSKLDGLSALTVIANPGNLGFPATMQNIMQTARAAGTAPTAKCTATAQWSAPNIGQTIYYRWYYRHAWSDAAGAANGLNYHPFQTADNGTWNWHLGNAVNGTFPLWNQWDAQPTDKAWPNVTNPGANLNKNHTYRFEQAITKVDATHYTMLIRIYNESGTLVFANDNSAPHSNLNSKFVVESIAPGTLEDFAGGYGRGSGGTGDLMLNSLDMGSNGGDLFATGPEYCYHGGVAVGFNGWLGPYSAVTG